MARPKRIHDVYWDYDTDPKGSPLALVIYEDRTFEYFRHDDIAAVAA